MAIKAYFSDQAGAPALTGETGSLIGVLDACLVNGYNQVNVVTMTRNGSIVTVTCASPHGYEDPAACYWVKNGVVNVAAIRGAAEADYNGDWPVIYESPTVFKFDIGTATPSSPATGTIVTKRAAAGFGKPFTDTGIAVYRSNAINGRRFYWQVIDDGSCPNGTGGVYAGWRGYESMTSATTGTGPFPSLAQVPWGQYVAKSASSDSTPRRWVLYSDGKTVFVVIHKAVTSSAEVSIYSSIFGFGDLLTLSPDPYAVFCTGDSVTSYGYDSMTQAGLLTPSGRSCPNPCDPSIGTAIARTYGGAQSPVFSAAILGMGYPQNYCIGSDATLMYPDPLSGAYFLSPIMLFEPSQQAVLRGMLPLYEGASGIVHRDREIIGNIVGREGRSFQFIRAGNHSGYTGGAYIDLTGVNGTWS